MTEDFSSKIEQLKDMLNNNQVSSDLQNMISMLSNNTKNESNEPENSTTNNDLDKIAMINKFKTILDKKNNIKDPRINLLTAIKPYLNSKRQDRIDSFIKMMNFTLLASIVKDEELL